MHCGSYVWCNLTDVTRALAAGRYCCDGISTCQVCKTASLLSGSRSSPPFSKTGTSMGSESVGANAFNIIETNMKFMDRKRSDI